MNHSAEDGGPLRCVGAAGSALNRAVSGQWENASAEEFKQAPRWRAKTARRLVMLQSASKIQSSHSQGRRLR